MFNSFTVIQANEYNSVVGAIIGPRLKILDTRCSPMKMEILQDAFDAMMELCSRIQYLDSKGAIRLENSTGEFMEETFNICSGNYTPQISNPDMNLYLWGIAVGAMIMYYLRLRA